ncbi:MULTISPECIES: hypothetical protein [Okeania]|nr:MULTISPECIES: hypothetical protein [Okeania]
MHSVIFIKEEGGRLIIDIPLLASNQGQHRLTTVIKLFMASDRYC